MKKLILIALIISVFTGIVFAQVAVPGNGLTSPQSTATVGRFRSMADNFIRADSYVDVKFDKFYTMVGYENAPNQANLGFATKAGNLYIGTYYGGTFLANIPNITYTEYTGNWLDKTDKSGVKSYDNLTNILGTPSPSNNLSILIGVADMGFRLSAYTNKKLFSDTDFVSGTTYFKSYETEAGVVTPQLLWSMTKNLTEKGIKPYAAVNMAFTKNYTKVIQYTNALGSWTAGDETVANSDIYTVTSIYAGLGGYTLSDKDGFKLSADLEYILRITGYENEYNYTDGSGKNKIKTGFQGIINGVVYTERSSTAHTITPSISGQWSDGPLALKFRLNLGVPISETLSTENSRKAGVNDGSLVKNGNDSKTVMIGLTPDFMLAAQWQIIPKLSLNLGGRIYLNTISNTTTDSKTYANGTVNDKSSTTTVTNTNPANISNTLAMGVTFNATDHITFEAASGASNGTVNVFGTEAGGLLYFTNLLISIKY